MKEKENKNNLAVYQQKEADKLPGMVRVSLAAYNTREEIDVLVRQLKKIANDKPYYRKHYQYSAATRSYLPVGMENRFWQEIENHCRMLLR